MFNAYVQCMCLMRMSDARVQCICPMHVSDAHVRYGNLFMLDIDLFKV